jgi:hypothetical protein
MADYYSQASFILPCSPEHAKVALAALNIISDFDPEWLSTRDLSSDHDPVNLKRIVEQCVLNHPDAKDQCESGVENGLSDDQSGLMDLCWDFCAEMHSEGLWIFSEDHFNSEHAAIFVQSVLASFDLPHMVQIEVAHACSRPRLDAFGGSAIAVTKTGSRFHDPYSFFEAEQTANNDNAAYYFCEITEIHSEYEYDSRFLMRCVGDEKPDDRLEEILLNYRGVGERDDAFNMVMYPGGTGGKISRMETISPLEYMTMSKYLTVL